MCALAAVHPWVYMHLLRLCAKFTAANTIKLVMTTAQFTGLSPLLENVLSTSARRGGSG
jgi:hypothetical protein